MRFKALSSLKANYVGASLLMVVLVVTSALIGYRIVSSSQAEATDNEIYRSQMLETASKLRNSIWLNREMLDEFLLEPGIDQIRDNIFNEFDKSLAYIAILEEQVAADNEKLPAELVKMQANLKQLSEHVSTVIETRLDGPKQYPSVAIGRDVMRPQQTVFFSAVELAYQEILEDGATSVSNDIYQDFQTVRQLWARLILNFRMYLANRLGSFSEEVLPIQEKESGILIKEIQIGLDKLRDYEKNDELGFQGAESLEIMEVAFNNWVSGYYDVVKIHQGGKWRTDKEIMLSHVNPLYLEIWDSLQNIEEIFHNLAGEDISNLSAISDMQLRMILFSCIFALFIIVIGYLFLNKLILNPIASLTKALKEGSEGGKQATLPHINVRETEDLLHAFNVMQQEVHDKQVDLKYQAMHDNLTGLPNRNLMIQRLEHAIAIARREKRTPGLIIMDLDGFKQVNDTLGHPVGDKLLIAIGARLLDLLRESDTVVRLGGDEFAVLIDDIDANSMFVIAGRILNVIQQPFEFESNQLFVSGSLGIAHYPIHGETSELLVQHADVAMYHAKRRKLGVTVYDPSFDENKVHKLSLISDLRDALSNDKLELYFQPKVDMSTMQTYGVEALLRWNHPEHGFIPPDQFIPLAEQSGLINQVFEWVFEKSAQNARRWIDLGLNLNVAVNLSVYDFQHHDIIAVIGEVLDQYNLSPSCFSIEVTEGAMMENPEESIKKLEAIDEMGLRISIDDFGTGYSSLSYLKKLPVDELKIDKSFVMQMDTDENDAIIVRSTIDLAHNLGLKVVAEGIENQDILDLLIILGCDVAQGFFLGKPMPAAEFEVWMGQWNSLRYQNKTG